jgi:hypothetical protein
LIELDSNRWSDLEHAYGAASDLPPMLRRLSAGDAGVMSSLFGSVCHQGSIYSASYAVVAHLMVAAKPVADPNLRAEILILIGSIRASRDDRSKVQPPADIQQSFLEALPEALELAIATLKTDLEPHTAVHLLQAATALKGYGILGRVLTGFLDEEFAPTCQGCGRDLYVWPDGDGLAVAAEDPVSHPTTKRTPVTRGPDPSSEFRQAYDWLTQVGGPSALDQVGAGLPFLFGAATCPACSRSFPLLDGFP